jgi:hypothetical protein
MVFGKFCVQLVKPPSATFNFPTADVDQGFKLQALVALLQRLAYQTISIKPIDDL